MAVGVLRRRFRHPRRRSPRRGGEFGMKHARQPVSPEPDPWWLCVYQGVVLTDVVIMSVNVLLRMVVT